MLNEFVLCMLLVFSKLPPPYVSKIEVFVDILLEFIYICRNLYLIPIRNCF